MKHDASWHPDPHTLVAFDRGTLGGAELSVVEDHLGQCAECVARLLHGTEDSLVARLRKLHASPQGDTAVTSQADTSGRAVPGSDHTLHWHPPARVPRRNDAEPVSGTVARFTLLSRIGAGGFGVVYKAHDPDLDRHVAIKVPHEANLRSPRHGERFLREARAAAMLGHPNICPVHEVGHWNQLPYFVMPLLEGMTLEQLLDGDQRPAMEQSVHWVRLVAETLEYAHSQGVVHRDLKPSNILIDKRGEPIVMDFGLAWRQSEQGSRLTGDLEMMGTPLYMSPEQARGNAATTSPATDIYSLGVVLYELLTGQPPFRGSLGELMAQILHEEPRPPAALNPQVPTELNAICMRCLAKDPTARFPSMEALARELAACPIGPVLPAPDAQQGVREPDTARIGSDPPIEALAPLRKSDIPLSAGHAAPAAAPNLWKARPARRTLGIAAALAGLGLAAVVVVRLLTDQGEIEIRSFDPNLDLTVSISRNGDVGDPLQLQEGQLIVEAYSGDIEIRVDGMDGSQVEIRNGRFRLGRGQKQRVEIVQRRPVASQEQAKVNKTAGDLLARCLELGRSGDFSQVVAVASDAIQVDPQSADAYEMRARAYAELGNDVAAVADCDVALRLNPQLVTAYVTSAQANVALGRLSEAVLAATAGLERDANSIPCYANRGMARAKRAQMQEALADFGAVIELAPGDARGYWYRAAVYRLLGDAEKSQADADRARQLQPQLRNQQLPDFAD